MVDVSEKAVTRRTARAQAIVKLGKEIIALIESVTEVLEVKQDQGLGTSQ